MFIAIHFESEWQRYSSVDFNPVLMNEDIEAGLSHCITYLLMEAQIAHDF